VDQYEKDVDELLARAWAYDDKPHLLYSHIMALAAKYENEDDGREICRLMQKRIDEIQVQKSKEI
jgi:hypothetical protein